MGHLGVFKDYKLLKPIIKQFFIKISVKLEEGYSFFVEYENTIEPTTCYKSLVANIVDLTFPN